jgi:hypothetical protein
MWRRVRGAVASPESESRMLDTKHLENRKISFRLKHNQLMFTGTVSKVENEGLWIDATNVVSTMQNDIAWGPMVAAIQAPVIFVPFSSLMFLIAAQE